MISSKSNINIQIGSSDHEIVSQLAMMLIEMGYYIIDLGYPTQNNLEADMLIYDSHDPDTNWQARIPTLDIRSMTEVTKGALKAHIEGALPNKGQPRKRDTGVKGLHTLGDRIFVRYKEKMVKLKIDQILYVEADRNYSRILCIDKEYIVAITLKSMEAKLPEEVFFRIHRSYLVNLSHIDEVAETHLVIARNALPVSKSQRAALFKRLQTI